MQDNLCLRCVNSGGRSICGRSKAHVLLIFLWEDTILCVLEHVALQNLVHGWHIHLRLGTDLCERGEVVRHVLCATFSGASY